MRATRVSCLILFAACGFSSHPPADGGTTEPDAGLYCTDPDGDGYGDGNACFGTDCREDDPTIQVCDCQPGSEYTGCPCNEEGRPAPCYEGPEDTAGLGICQAGLRFCRDRRWSTCGEQVTPLEEICNDVDDDCDGVVDDGVRNACGTCGECNAWAFGVEGNPFVIDDDDLMLNQDGSITVDPDGDLDGEMSMILQGEGGCPPTWGPIYVDADVPANTELDVFARAADQRDQLPARAFTTVLRMPGDDDEAPLFPGGSATWWFLEIRLLLAAERFTTLPTLRTLRVGIAEECGD